MRHRLLITILAALLGGSHAHASVQGHLVFDAERSTAVGGIAWIEDDLLSVVLSDQIPDMDAIAADGKLDRRDLLQLGGRQLELRIDPETGELWGFTLSQPGEVLSGSHEGLDTALTLAEAGPFPIGKHIKGRFDDGEHSITFDLPVLGTDLPLPGEAQGPDGGAPGAAFRTLVQAIAAGDLDTLINGMAAENRAEMQEAIDEGYGTSVIARAQSFWVKPDGLEIQGARATADRAWVDYTGQDGFGQSRGTARFVLDNGRWLFEESDSSGID